MFLNFRRYFFNDTYNVHEYMGYEHGQLSIDLYLCS